MTNKNYILIVYLILLFTNSVISQELQGTFYEKDNSEHSEYFHFDSSYVDFVISSDGCLRVNFRGNGFYEIVEHYLIIKTEEIKNPESFYESFPNNKKVSSVNVLSLEGETIPYVQIAFIDEENKIISGIFTDMDGLASVKPDFEIKKLKVSFVGFQGLTFDFHEGMDYEVYLSDGVILEYKDVVFKINSMGQDELNLTLLSIDFKYKKNLKTALHKLERKTAKLSQSRRSYVK
ncbi:MAG TPA: hypothetical protein VFC92_12815 [Bacteroidales bacterium]|nr:hypothetical protein [Bacteroidales bacterium]